MEYSHYQTAIFDFVKNERKSLLVDAKAGSGKTTTMVRCMDFVHPDDKIGALAFNKAIATVLQRKVPSLVDARTFNSLGFGTVMREFAPKMNFKKNYGLLKQAVPSNYDDLVADLARVMSHGKAWGVGVFEPNSEEVWYNLLDSGEFDIPTENIKQAASWLAKAYKKGLSDTKNIDFDDQILFPIYYELRGRQYDVLFVDEMQDMSPLQHEFIHRYLAPSGRVIGFGDPRQAIYGFRGADTESMQNFGRKFSCESLPLSISYRCARSIIHEAQTIVPDIEYREGAPDGIVDTIPLPDLSEFAPEDLILCRNNAPLITLGLRFLAANLAVNVRGEFGAQIIAFVKKFKTDNIGIFTKRLESWYDVEKNQAEKEEKWRKVHIICEKYEALKAVLTANQPNTVDELINIFHKLFDSDIGTTLSSIHRAKGEEARRVYLIKPEFIPSKYARTEAQLQQEYNLKYVAITRAMEEFYYTEWGF